MKKKHIKHIKEGKKDGSGTKKNSLHNNGGEKRKIQKNLGNQI